MASRVGERGQVTIEKTIREELGVYAGDQAVQHIENGRVVIDFVPAAHRRSLAGALRDKISWPETAVPPCRQACPIGIDIPGYVRLIAQGHIGVQVWVNQGTYSESEVDGTDAQAGQASKKPKRSYKR